MISSLTAIQKTTGPCVILAGAGTGKTTTIIEKLKYIVENKVFPPERIVCITFSNEAANNLLLRVQNSIPLEKGKEPIIRTFHAFSADLLRMHGEKIGIEQKFKILDPEQAMILIHRNLKVHERLCPKYISTINTLKDLGISLEQMQNYIRERLKSYENINIEKHLENLNVDLYVLHTKKLPEKKKTLVEEIKMLETLIGRKKFTTVWSAYEKMKVKGNYLDYADLNSHALTLLESFPEIAKQFDQIIVDEFQDTNKIQLDFLIKLAPHGNITVVGDINQSIYRFRGAHTKNLSKFKQVWNVEEKDILTLARSFRSPNKVLRAAHKLISKNYENPEECFFVENAEKREGASIEVYEMPNAQEESRKVVELIKREKERGSSYEDMCVMYRSHYYNISIRSALDEAGIPYASVSHSSLLKQKSVRTARDYLTILNSIKKREAGGEQAWWDLVYQLDFSPPDLVQIGTVIHNQTKKDKLRKNDSETKNLSPEVAFQQKELISLYMFTHLETLPLSPEGKKAAHALIEKLKLLLLLSDKSISELVQETFRISGLLNEEKTKDDKEIMLNLQKFSDLAKLHEDLYDSDLSNFLYYLSILEKLNIEINAAKLEEKGVRLMTCHATKGLEYKTVILTNMSAGRFPIERYTGNPLIPTELLPDIHEELKHFSEEERDAFITSYEKHQQLLEERRLAYVSFTRAKENLIITYALSYGNKNVGPSSFLNEIEYSKNPDISFIKDDALTFKTPLPKIEPAINFSTVLSKQEFPEVLSSLAAKKTKEEKRRLSPSALLLFSECQKEFEYRYVYHMPERKTFSWEAMRLGSFVHLVLERGVRGCFQTLEQFISIARENATEDEWKGLELSEAEMLIRVFFERNKEKYSSKSLTEQYLPLMLSGISFMGFADRIDFTPLGIEIIDYKTGKTTIAARDRNWQLGFYALAAQAKYGKVRKVVLDMLKQEKPLEFAFDEKGNASCLSSSWIKGFSLADVERELLETAKAIEKAYESGFSPCTPDKNCDFCNEYVYGC